MGNLQRLSILVGLVLLGLAVTSLLSAEGIAIPLSLGVGGVKLPWQGAVVVLLAAMACAGVDSLVRSHPRARNWPTWSVAPFWALPAAITLTAALFLGELFGTRMWWLGLLLTAAALTGTVLAQLYTLEPGGGGQVAVRLALTLTVLLVSVVLFSRLAQLKPIGYVGALAVAAAGSGLALELLRQPDASSPSIYPYSLATGIVLGEVAWALDFVPIPALLAGGALGLLFYLLSGLARQQLEGGLQRGVLAEYAAISATGILALYVLLGP